MSGARTQQRYRLGCSQAGGCRAGRAAGAGGNGGDGGDGQGHTGGGGPAQSLCSEGPAESPCARVRPGSRHDAGRRHL